MSANYYTTIPACECCGCPEQELHIGKFVNGRFILHIIPERGLVDRESWLSLLEKHAPISEYGEEIDLSVFRERIGTNYSKLRVDFS